MIVDREYIKKAKEKLGDSMALLIAEELGITNFDRKAMKMCCPFHEEKTPSFIWNHKTLSYHCFGACGRNYDIIDAFMHNGCTYIEALQKLFELADIHYAFGEHHVKTHRNYRYPQEVISTNKEKVYNYLSKRGISKDTVDYLDIRQDENGNCVFNYYDDNDVLMMVKYRPSHKVKKNEVKNWCQKGADTTPLLFNMNRINIDSPLIITCGELDCAASIECGLLNTVSIPLGDGNMHWIERNFDWLEQFTQIIICSDNDESGNKFKKEVVPRLGRWRCKTVQVPEDCKDVNEVLYRHGKPAVIDMIDNAQEASVDTVVDLSEVEDIDYDSIDGVYTGIKGLDDQLMKLFFGTLTIVSGQPGAGKTSFLYQIICQALDQGKNTFLFSRELPDWMTRNWFNYILSGRRHLVLKETSRGVTRYRVDYKTKKEIGEFYKGRWFAYRDDQSNKLEDVLTTMEDVVRKYGVKLVVLDNLMTLDIGANDSNELQKQTDTINQLIHFSMKYDVAVVLVAHPRKMINTTDVGIYDISGSSNIVNLAHRTIGLRRVTEAERRGVMGKNGEWLSHPCKYNVNVRIIKDRIWGRADYNEGIYYDDQSRRFFTNPEEFDFHYQWDKSSYDSPIAYPIVDETDEVFGSVG